VNDLAALVVRLVQGSLLAGHGAQKLFGTFGGHGLEGTSGFMEMLGLRPGRPWAFLAGLCEFGGGVLTALGLLNPLGPMGIIASMSMATAKAHWGKPIWVTEGGAELPVTNTAISTALLLSGPGKYSLDRALGDPPAGLAYALGACGDHTNRVLRRSRGSRASGAGGGGAPGRGARGAGGGRSVTRASLIRLAALRRLGWISI
jgi:putative oxidoreductase